MTRDSSPLQILKVAARHKLELDAWFANIVRFIMTEYQPQLMGAMANLLYFKDGQYRSQTVNAFDPDAVAYKNLVECNFNQGTPLFAASLIIPMERDRKDGTTELIVFVTMETPLIKKRQIWIEITNPKTDKKHLVLDHYLSANIDLPKDIKRFNQIIVPVFNSN